MQDHGVGDVRNVKFVKTNQLVALGNFGPQRIQRVLRTLQHMQFTVHLPHEFVKVQPHLALDGHGIEKAVHQKAFTPPYAAVHVHPAWNFRLLKQLFERVRAFGLVRSPVIGTALQRIHGAQLGGIGGKTFGGEFGLIGRTDRLTHAHPAFWLVGRSSDHKTSTLKQ